MKTLIKGLIVVLLVAASSSAVLAGDAAIPDEPLPPEVQKLIGMRIPPEIAYMKTAKIPGFTRVNGGVVAQLSEETGSLIAYAEGVFDGDMPVFFIERVDLDRTVEILDAHLLPVALLSWRLNEGKPAKGNGRYRLSAHCRANNSNLRSTLGLVRPEDGKESCAHFSKQIRQAWRLDEDSGRLVPFSSKELECEYITMNSCY